MSETNNQEPVIAPQPSPFSSSAWNEGQPSNEPAPAAAQDTPAAITPTPPATPDEEILDPNDWLKRELNVESIDVLKSGWEEYNKLKSTPQTPEEIKFANDASKQFFEYLKEGKEDDIYSFLDTKRKLSSAEKLNATEAIKLQIAQANKHYTPEDIQDVYEERYSIPRKPIQAVDETDEDYTVKVNEWQTSVDKINRRIERDAVSAKQELSKLIPELVLPEIKKPEPQGQQPSQESLEALKKVREQFIQKLESNYANAKGFETKVKDESVELPVAFNIPDADRVAIKESLADFDVNGYLDKRWFDEQGNPKIEQMIYDRYILDNLDKVLSGVANNAASQRLAAHIKAQSNVHINNGEGSQSFQPTPTAGKQASPFSSGSWSEKPVFVQN